MDEDAWPASIPSYRLGKAGDAVASDADPIELWTEVWPANVTCVHCKHHIESYFVILVCSCCEEIVAIMAT